MKQIKISDATLKQTFEDFHLSFKEKIELSKLLNRLGVDVIELEGIKNVRTDSLQIKAISTAVTDSIVAVPVELSDKENIEKTWAALSEAKHPRLQVCAPVSAVQMEYLNHKKPEAMLTAIRDTVAACSALCSDVEFIANDATRSEQGFLTDAISTAIEAGAKTVTLCDTAGTMLPTEFADFIKNQYGAIPKLRNVTLGISSANTISMADALAIAAVSEGAEQICASAYPINCVSLANVAKILSAKTDTIGAFSNVNTTQLSRTVNQISMMCQPVSDKRTHLAATENSDSDIFLTAHDNVNAVAESVKKLGYDLSDEDILKVYNAFLQIADKKEKVGLKELDAIIASSAMQVPETYKLDTYVITSGNTISATAHIKLAKNGETVEGVYIGDGSIDAAFQAIEKITGCHYELDDFQLQAVTEGREAMGQTIVKLRSGGKVYSGKGISTDIVGAGIHAYLCALNKIIYEEEIE